MKGKEVRWASGKKLEGENDRRLNLEGFGNLEGWGCSLSYVESCKGDKNENKKSKKGEVRGEMWAVKGLWWQLKPGKNYISFYYNEKVSELYR